MDMEIQQEMEKNAKIEFYQSLSPKQLKDRQMKLVELEITTNEFVIYRYLSYLRK